MSFKKTLFLFLTGIIFTHVACMDQPSSKAEQSSSWLSWAGNILLGISNITQFLPLSEEPIDPFAFTALPQDIQNQIIQLLSINTTAESLDTAVYTINSLARVNKELNAKINDPKFCMQLIKHLSEKFNCSNFQVCNLLKTQASKQILEQQGELYELCTNTNLDISKEELQGRLFLLVRHQADLEFTYSQPWNRGRTVIIVTPFMLASVNNGEIIPMLASYNINVNATNAQGTTALMLAATSGGYSSPDDVQKILDCKGLDINQQDKDGNTALILSIKKRIEDPRRINPFFTTIVEKLCAAGADPELANNAGETALAVAQQLPFGADDIIRIINETIEKKHAQ